MKSKVQKWLVLLVGGVMTIAMTTPAMAYWHPYYGHGYDHYSYYHHHYYYGGDQLAAGLLVGGLVGVMAGSAMASSQPTYVQNNYYSEAPFCYKQKAWSRKFCNENGCFIKTAWRTVCH